MLNHIHDMVEILMMSLALGMDAFSLSLGLGLHGMSREQAYELSFAIGIFHVFMTLVGLSAGLLVQGVMGHFAHWFGAFLLLGMGLHMMYSTLFVRKQDVLIGQNITTVMAFSAGVSVDALSVGLSLGLRSTAYGLVSAAMFGIVGGLMCLLGVFVGKRASNVIGIYGELVGAFILIGYGIHFLRL